jgi:predicted dithiol-disulfide oxidoreductase (DUF899 family)
MHQPPVVSREEWLAARKALLEREKALTRQRDETTRERQKLPMVKLEKAYTFTGPEGSLSLQDLFGRHPQLIVYHFMLGPDETTGCKSCSFLADNFQGSPVHLAARGIAFTCVSHAPLPTIEAFKKRMGWTHRWVSSYGSDFNYDFGVTFDDTQRDTTGYNYGKESGEGERPGLSVFLHRGADVFHTYSTYARGLDPLIATYQLIDLTPAGRHEEELKYGMEWLRHHDRYDAST